ncbi:ribonuclease D [Pectobacterium cacticida]|uniref:Ribonuclease D n=1 Tax=Pectobacterium cacticida TaxID=69221 RepID=A0ABZ2G4V6_9GAMM|nr:ribonuclease D [Pectobacterium cacticida]UYX05314.1 ribonuclease D [Pectobacterium cacticida]
MNYQLITSDTELEQVCNQARRFSHVALDTEFVRTRTYYPQLGLIQLFDGDRLSLIDPLTVTNWSPFQALLQDEQVKKFLHAGSEDLEVFLNAFGVVPSPFIDTQILAAFLGKPLSYGFAALVADYTGIMLDKSESRTDWLARPLSEKQCDYAAADVFYLLPVATQLEADTQAAGWMRAALDECLQLCSRKQDILSPMLAYREFGNAWQLRGRQLACLQRLAEWRLRKARERDSAVNFVVREENLLQVARFLPTSLGELSSLGLSGPEIRYHGKTLLDCVAETEALNESDFPPPVINLIDYPGYKIVFKAIKSLVQRVSVQSGLSTELLASRRQINRLLSWHWKLNGQDAGIPEMLSGWRGELYGDELREIIQGY